MTRVQLARKVRPASTESPGLPAQQVRRELLVPRDPLDRMVLQVLQVRRVLKDLLALPGQQGPRVLRVRPALTVSPALQVQLVLKELQVRKAPKDPQESQGSPARLVRRAQPELTE